MPIILNMYNFNKNSELNRKMEKYSLDKFDKNPFPAKKN